MTTSVCHGLPSYLEPAAFVEPQLLRLKLTPTASIFPQSVSDHKTDRNSENENTSNAEKAGWESLLSLPATTTTAATASEAAVYIHPLAKRSESLLSERSLEMCTESLGCETGSDTGDDFPSGEPSRNQDCGGFALATARRRCIARGGARLPLPMPLIGGVHFRSHREGGRLVLRAVEVDSPVACFKAERANGRLRLSFEDRSEEDDGNRGEDMEGNFENVEGKVGNLVELSASL